MAQIRTYKIDGSPVTPWRGSEDVEIEAIFGVENTASITLDGISLPNSELNQNSDTIRSKWLQKPLEGVGVSMEVSDTSINGNPFTYNFQFYADWNKLVFEADNETTIGLIKEKSVLGFEERCKSITFALLEEENFMNQFLYSNIPYVVENRKTILEKIILLSETTSTSYKGANEVVKIINIASDIISIGIILAIVNLAVAIIKLVKLIVDLVKLFKEIKETFFPSVLYHRGVQPWVFIGKAVEYLGFSGLEFGDFENFGKVMQRLHICPSKFNEIGQKNDVGTSVSGALNPSDYGYNAFEMIQFLKDAFDCKVGIINDVVHIRPNKDPFWTLNPTSNNPDVLVEQAFTDNGTIRPNYDELFSSTILKYQTDDSDLWTLEDLADESDPTTSQKIISGVIVSPIGTTQNNRVIPQKGKIIDIPYALCKRKNVLDDLLDVFDNMIFGFKEIKEEISKQYDALVDTLGEGAPKLAGWLETFGGRSGAMQVENHYFSTAKLLLLVPTQVGGKIKPLIPAEYADFIGAKALMSSYHRYNSFVQGVRNPSNFGDTNAKYYYEDVKIHLNLEKFASILDNPYFNTPEGGVGKYTSIKWNVAKDKATVSYWKPKNWLINARETSI